jgi:uncharacterized protein (DUF736 family)
MAMIGTFKLTQDGRFEGKVTTLTISTRLNIVPNTKSSDDQPDYRVYAGNAELGAGWSKVSDRGNDYLSLVLDDPSFAAPVYAALVPTAEPDAYRLVWNRRRRDSA